MTFPDRGADDSDRLIREQPPGAKVFLKRAGIMPRRKKQSIRLLTLFASALTQSARTMPARMHRHDAPVWCIFSDEN
jgi:hypothetical protein